MKTLSDANHTVYLSEFNSAVVRETEDGLWSVTLGLDYKGTYVHREGAEEAARDELEVWEETRAKVAAQKALQAIKEILAPIITSDVYDPKELDLAKLLHKAIIDNGAG